MFFRAVLRKSVVSAIAIMFVISAIGAAFVWSRQTGVDSEKKKEAIKKAAEAYEEAQKWANRPGNRNATVKRLRDAAKRRKD